MLQQLPIYISVVFILCTAYTLWAFYKAASGSSAVLLLSIGWLLLQSALGLCGFYTVTDTMPPRVGLLIGPPLVLIITLFATARGRAFTDGLHEGWLTAVHIARIAVELVLLGLFMHGLVPKLMTFEGRNFDIFSGLSALAVWYFCYYRGRHNKKLLLAWNLICLVLLFNIVINAILSVPTPFQQFGFEQPNTCVLYFPFVWLPCFIVPVVLFSHLALIRKLLSNRLLRSSQ